MVAFRVSLRLHVNVLKAKRVLLDDAVDAAIAGAAEAGGAIGGSAVANRDEQVEDGLFKEAG
jgi:hypothetical protein